MNKLILLVAALAGGPLPEVIVTADNVRIDRSCRITIPPETIIEDGDGDGVIHIIAPDVVVEFTEGSVLRGAPADRPPDEYRGVGVRIDGHSGVTLRGLRVSGYWCGVRAGRADGLTLERIDASDNRRARLLSTAEAEHRDDWMFPHDNDDHEWYERYAAAMLIESSRGVTVRECRVQDGQNGLIFDRVDDSRVYDNDFSFNSGWGIALWRSSRNVISRNACDFNVRGYSHGVYNRGQDSAGILMFEQCNQNLVAENSATHCGDGFFGFAGQEALGVRGDKGDEWHRRRGVNDNLLIGNDFSYAAAHGIEITFSFGNRLLSNRLVGNAICGVWGGYSSDTLIADNEIADNGDAGYRLERGGVNIEHGQRNRIERNRFRNNRCGVHLWWDDDEALLKTPWARANGGESSGNVIRGNRFDGDRLALHFRGPSDVIVGHNDFHEVGERIEREPEARVDEADQDAFPFEAPEYSVPGNKRPVGARTAWRGREHIVMTEWGPRRPNDSARPETSTMPAD